MSDLLCLMAVHAHPDDESSKGAATVAKYHAEGVRTVLVCATGGEEGDILNPAVDTEEIRANLAHRRREELRRAAAIIGYDEVVMLGYRDSGMAGTPANDRPDSFAQAPEEEAVGRLVTVIRRERPHVVVTYGEDQRGYPHPDHLRVHTVSVAAFAAAGDPSLFPEAGVPWQPLKLYYSRMSAKWQLATHEKYLELGLPSPFDEQWLERMRGLSAAPASTIIAVAGFTSVRRDALLAHETQVDPTSSRWFGLPPEVDRLLYPYDEYQLARSLVPIDEEAEDDLFAGVRQALVHQRSS